VVRSKQVRVDTAGFISVNIGFLVVCSRPLDSIYLIDSEAQRRWSVLGPAGDSTQRLLSRFKQVSSNQQKSRFPFNHSLPTSLLSGSRGHPAARSSHHQEVLEVTLSNSP
jgi:hypothetical protein